MDNNVVIKLIRREIYGENDTLETITNGNLEILDSGKSYKLTYKEYDNDVNLETSVTILFDADKMEIKKRGYVNLDMVVSNEKKFRFDSEFVTNFGRLPITTISDDYYCELIGHLIIVKGIYNSIISDEMIGKIELTIQIFMKKAD